MRNRRYLALILAGVLFAGTALAGCGSREEEVVEEPEVMAVDVVAEIVPIEDEEEMILVVGDSENATESVQMTNEMGGTIIGLAVKEPDDEKTYPENLMGTDQRLEEEEKADVYYEPEEEIDADLDQAALLEEETYGLESDLTGDEEDVMTQAEAVELAWAEAYGSDTGSETAGMEGEVYDQDADIYAMEGYNTETEGLEDEENDHGYFLQVTMDNGDIYELAYFDIDDMDEVSVCLDGAIAYLQYTSISKQTLVNTKAAELIIKSYRDAAEDVIVAINAIPAVSELNAEIVLEQALEARALYDSLTDPQKAFVTNYAHLVEVENALGLTVGTEEVEEVYEEVVETVPEEVVEEVETYDYSEDTYSDTTSDYTTTYPEYPEYPSEDEDQGQTDNDWNNPDQTNTDEDEYDDWEDTESETEDNELTEY